jgi:hypothetical protein
MPLMQQLMQSPDTELSIMEPSLCCRLSLAPEALTVLLLLLLLLLVCVSRATSTWALATLLPTCPLAQGGASASGSALPCRRCAWAWCSSCSASTMRLTGP